MIMPRAHWENFVGDVKKYIFTKASGTLGVFSLGDVLPMVND